MSWDWACSHCGTQNHLPAPTCFHCSGLRVAPSGASSVTTHVDPWSLAAQIGAVVVAAIASGFALSRLLGL